jgi:hypothetical protein
MNFDVEGIAVALCILGIFGWMLAVVRIANREGALTGRPATFGTAVGVAFVLGIALVGLGLVLPKGSLPQYAAVGSGGAFGSFAWLGFPFWLLWARNGLSRMSISAAPASGEATDAPSITSSGEVRSAKLDNR